MSDNTNGTNRGNGNGGLNGIGSADDGINTNMEGADNTDINATDTADGGNDHDVNGTINGINAANGTTGGINSANGADGAFDGFDAQFFEHLLEVVEFSNNYISVYGRGLCSANDNVRCPDCGRLSDDTLLLHVSRKWAEAQAATAGMAARAVRCPACRRLWVSHDHNLRDEAADNMVSLVRTELQFFTDFSELLSHPAAASAAAPSALSLASNSNTQADEYLYGDWIGDVDDESSDSD